MSLIGRCVLPPAVVGMLILTTISLMFYNYAITPAIQASLDLQYNNSAVTTVDDGFVVGLRFFTQF